MDSLAMTPMEDLVMLASREYAVLNISKVLNGQAEIKCRRSCRINIPSEDETKHRESLEMERKNFQRGGKGKCQ